MHLQFTFFAALLAIITAFEPSQLMADDGAKITPDVVYGHKDGLAMTYDILRPTQKAKGIGLLFMVSGGWVSPWSDPQKSSPFIQPLLDHGYTVFAVRHGSSPRYVIPEIAVDVKSALAHIHSHARDYGVDPSRLGVYGFSAGGHLSLYLGTTTNAQSEPTSPHVAAVVAIFPPTDLAPYVDPANPLREQFPALKFDPAKAADYSPLSQVSKDDAPSLMIHGDKDELVPIWHSQKIVEAFAKESVKAELITFAGAGHGFNDVQNEEMFDAMVRWFNTYLDNK
jgi:acetyl esterase/lipase